ncbi:hypothetical protein ILYODFUR_033964 [Ilyodon furcidens]|uniref:Uncharacterized protein n=1 Tax=Ilyodon furcidens TaxID=33524 RepID=A0ABV0U1B0_9TELE
MRKHQQAGDLCMQEIPILFLEQKSNCSGRSLSKIIQDKDWGGTRGIRRRRRTLLKNQESFEEHVTEPERQTSGNATLPQIVSTTDIKERDMQVLRRSTRVRKPPKHLRDKC